MEQNILIPQKIIRHLIEFIKLNVADKDNVTANVTVLQDETGRQNILNIVIKVNELFIIETTAGNLTTANITGFKKCIKAICAKALDITFTEVNDPL